MSIDPEIGSRHMLGTDGLAEQPNAMHQYVRIVISQDWADSVPGQLIAECLVNLLARQVGLVEQLEIVSADVPLLIHPIIKGVWQTLTEYLVAVGEWAVGMKVRTGDNSSPHEADHTIVIGGATTLDSAKTIACIADSWKAWVGELKNVPDDRPSPSLNPVGPFFAAALAAGEIFKRTWGLRRGRFLDNHAYSLWKNSMSSVWEELDAGPALNELHLPPFVLVGAGAVGNALAYVLIRLENRDIYPVLVDDDVYDKTNLNRCSLAGTEDLNQEKTAVLASRLEEVGIASFPFSGDLKRFVNDGRVGIREPARHAPAHHCARGRPALPGDRPVLAPGRGAARVSRPGARPRARAARLRRPRIAVLRVDDARGCRTLRLEAIMSKLGRLTT